MTKFDVLLTERTPYDVLRFSDRTPTEHILRTITDETPMQKAAIQLSHDALVQDVLEEAREALTSKT